MKHFVLCTFTSDSDLTEEDATHYVYSAVGEMRGSYEPASPEFEIDRDSVRVLNVSDVPTNMTLRELFQRM